jgi:spore germination protein
MHERLIAVNRDVQELYVNLNTVDIAWLDQGTGMAVWPNKDRVAPASAQGEEGQIDQPGSVRSGLEKLDASLQKLPPFSYGGQTDTHSVPEPLGLPKSIVTEAEAKDIAAGFLETVGYPGATPESSGTSNGPFPGYVFKYESATIDVCKRGGVVTLFRDERSLGLQQLSVDQAASQAMLTLRTLGWNNFVKTSTEDFGGYIQLEAVGEEENTRMYPDKIRVTVGKDTGKIMSYDSTPYWLYHHSRDLKTKISPEQARTKLRSDITVKESRLAVISLPGWQEAFCYEFRGSKGTEEFLIYINALDGTEEKIQRIIRTPRGEFLQ